MRVDKWELLAIIAAIFNPIPTGVLAGYFLHRDKYRSGVPLLVFSVIWGIVVIYLTFSGKVPVPQ